MAFLYVEVLFCLPAVCLDFCKSSAKSLADAFLVQVKNKKGGIVERLTAGL